ncbi:MAG: rhodanese-like domain-containing protein [Treponema sp.]|jgi:rhodanese-related sulfurtransferase|nr:rhodanese-like domain-containing protein [Treponema sp.]
MMKNHGVIVIFTLLTVSAIGVSCKSADTDRAAQDAAPDIFHALLPADAALTPEISTAELQDILERNSAVVFDARPFMEFAVSHIPGAVNLAAKPGVSKALYVSDVAEVGRVVGENKDAPLVIYCNGPYCGKAVRLSAELLGAGYTKVKRYQLGKH